MEIFVYYQKLLNKCLAIFVILWNLDGFLHQNGHSIKVNTKGAQIVQNCPGLRPKAVLRALGSPIWNCQAGLDILPSPP